MKTRLLQNCVRRYFAPGDTLELTYHDGHGREHLVAKEKMGRHGAFDAVVIFEVEEGEYHENVTDGIGGAFLDTGGRGVE